MGASIAGSLFFLHWALDFVKQASQIFWFRYFFGDFFVSHMDGLQSMTFFCGASSLIYSPPTFYYSRSSVCLPFLPFSSKECYDARQSPLGNQWSGRITFRKPYSSSSMTFYYSRTVCLPFSRQSPLPFFLPTCICCGYMLRFAHAKKGSYKGSNSPLVSW